MDVEHVEPENGVSAANIGDLVPREVLENPGLYAVAGLAVLVYQHRAALVGWIKRIFGKGR